MQESCQDVAHSSELKQTALLFFFLHTNHTSFDSGTPLMKLIGALFIWQWNAVDSETMLKHIGAEWNTRVLILNRFTFLKHTTAQIDCPCLHTHCTSFHGELVKHRRGQWDTEWKHTIGETQNRSERKSLKGTSLQISYFSPLMHTMLPHVHCAYILSYNTCIPSTSTDIGILQTFFKTCAFQHEHLQML